MTTASTRTNATGAKSDGSASSGASVGASGGVSGGSGGGSGGASASCVGNGSVVRMLEDFDREHALASGANPARVREWDTLRRVYIQPSRHPAQQRHALKTIEDNNTHPDKLILIENQIRHIEDDTEKWRLRHRLLGVEGNYESVRRQAKKLVPAKQTPPPKKALRIRTHNDTHATLSATMSRRDIADIEAAISCGLDPNKAPAPQKLDNLLAILRGNIAAMERPASAASTASTGSDAPVDVPHPVPFAVPRPIIVISLDQHTAILNGEGDDIVLALTDGTTMTGVEYLNLNHAGDVEAALFHPEYGPVNLYRSKRHANQKQSDLVSLASPACLVPDCRHGADSCQMHHITAWKHGGETNVNNLAPLCQYHNRTNNDDPQACNQQKRARSPNARNRGRVENIRGRPTWVSPRGYPIENAHNTRGAMTTLFGAPRR